MELIELDATAQRALELLTNAGMSDGSIYDYTHTGFGSILRHFHTKGILYATAEMLDNFLLEQRVLLDQGDISQWKWGLVRMSCELLKQCATMNSIDLPDLQPWDPVWNRQTYIPAYRGAKTAIRARGGWQNYLSEFAQSGGDAPGVPPDRENHAGKDS